MSDRVFTTPALTDEEIGVLALIEELRDELRPRIADPRRWSGGLRRMAFARAVQGSNSIEGFNASLDDVAAAVDGEPALDADTETELALTGYRDAMTYVLQVGQDDLAIVDEGLLKALHFMMLKHDLSKGPGQWRSGYIAVRDDSTGKIVYEGPPADRVPELIAKTLSELEREDVPILIRAAMAHLNLVMVHPFRDGNGRMARALQTLIVAREQMSAPVFSSIEEYLGRNTGSYYAVLARVGRGAWHPENDARPWTRFCLVAHYRQAQTQSRRIQEAEALWSECAEYAARNGLPERAAGGLVEAAYGFRLRNATYRSAVRVTAGEEISELTASRDLKRMVDLGALVPVGERRGRHYVGDRRILDVRERIRAVRATGIEDDPFEVVRRRAQLTLTD
jgi:Fic family protein